MPLSLLLAGLLALGSAAGLQLFSNAPRLPLVLALAAAVGACAARFRGARGATLALLAIAVVAAAAWRAATVAVEAERPPLVKWFEARVANEPGGDIPGRAAPVHIRGRLAADASSTPFGAQLQLVTTAVEQNGVWKPVSGSLSASVSGELLENAEDWRAGRTIAASIALRRPAEYRNDGLPDPRAQAWRGSALVGSIKSGALVEVLAPGMSWDEGAAAIRAHVRGALRRHVAPHDPTSAAIGIAILIGDRAALPPEVELRLQEAGTYHVIAISGGNIALLAGAVLGLLWCLSVRFAAAAAITIPILIGHGWVVGGGPSVARATTAACLYLSLRLIDQRTAPVHALALAAALMLAASPLQIASAGFWLTFGATAALVMAVSRRAAQSPGRWWSPIAAVISSSLAVEALLLPVTAYVFERVTVAGPVLNLIAIPAMAVVQAAASVCAAADWLGLTGIASWSGLATHLAARGLVESAGLIALVPWVTWRVPAPPFALLVTFYALVAIWWWTCRPPVDTLVRLRVQRVSLVGAVVAWFWVALAPGSLASPRPSEVLRLTALDVGQGDSLLLTMPEGRTVMVDAGGVPGTLDIGDRVVGPALRARGLRRLDYVAVTHADLDHLGGATTVVREFKPREVWAGVPVTGHAPLDLLRATAVATRTPWRWLQRGDRLESGAVELRVHHPPLPDWERQRVRNDDSLVLEVRYGAVSVWLTGDISGAVELEILDAIDPRRVNVLKVPHHGSLTSSSPEWVRRLRPAAVLVSAGRGNLFGHPAPAVLHRYEAVGAALFRTDQDGQIDLVTNGTFVEINTFTGRRWRLR